MEEFDVGRELVKLYKEIEDELIANTKETKILTPDGTKRVQQVCEKILPLFHSSPVKFRIEKPRPLATHASLVFTCTELHLTGEMKFDLLDALAEVTAIDITYYLDGRLELGMNIPDVYFSYQEEIQK